MCGESGGGRFRQGESSLWFLIVVPHSGATIFTHFHYLHTFVRFSPSGGTGASSPTPLSVSPHSNTPDSHIVHTIIRSPRACEEQGHWRELTYLYIQYDEYDNAAACMMTHSTTAWEHVQFKDVTVKVTNTDVHYKGLQVWYRPPSGSACCPNILPSPL